MTLLFEDETDCREADEYRDLAVEVMEEALDREGCPFEVQVSLTLTDPESVRIMNRDFRGIDADTDVLSFPLLSFSGEADFSFLDGLEENELAAYFEPDSGELLLGDIVINMERVMEQAESYGHSIQREFAFLVAHSMLHLMGFDHTGAEDTARMEKEQREILEYLGITRD